MVKKLLHGCVTGGCGDARNWGIEDIRKATGCDKLYPGTINVKLDAPHYLRVDCKLDRKDRSDLRDEDLYFERCSLITPTAHVDAFIARTSTNYWGNDVLEIMAEWLDGIKIGDAVDVDVCVD